MTLAVRKVESSEARVRRLIARADRDLRQRFLDALDDIRGQRGIRELSRLLAAGRFDEALAFGDGSWLHLLDGSNDAFLSSARDMAERISITTGERFAFDVTDPSAVNAMRNARNRRVQGFTDETRRAMRAQLRAGMTRGISPTALAREVRSSVGLTARQVSAVEKYRQLLESNSRQAFDRVLRDRRFDSSIARALESGEPLSAKQIDRMVDRYRQRLVSHRAQVIAQTESRRAIHEGQETALRQAVSANHIESTAVTRVWNTVPDDRRRFSHAEMQGQTRLLGELFVSGKGNTLRHPGDINAPRSEIVMCRCWLSTSVAAEQ